MQWDASFLSLDTPCPIKCSSPLQSWLSTSVSMPHEILHNCKLQPSMSLLVSRGCRFTHYLSLEVADSHSDMWLVVTKLPDSIVSIWGTRLIIQEISMSTDFSSISWLTQGTMYPQRCSGQTLIFEILKVSNDDILFSGLLSFWTLFVI
jgi:hypothetical protein